MKIKLKISKNNNFYLKSLLLMIPMIFQGLMDNFISLFNTFISGKFINNSNNLKFNNYNSEDIISGISSQNIIFEIIWCGLIGIVISGNIFTSKYYGAKKNLKTQETINIKLFYMIIFSIISIIIVQIWTKEIINLILGNNNDNKKENSMKIGIYYTKIITLSYPLLAISYCFSMTMNCIGKTKITIFSSITAVVINLIFSLCFCYIDNNNIYFKITGLGIGVILSWLFSTMIYIFYFLIKKPKYWKFKNIFYITKKTNKKMLKLLTFNLINQLILSFFLMIQISIFTKFGPSPNTIISLQIVFTILSLLFSIFRPLSGLTSFFISKELGNKNINKAEENRKKIFSLILIVTFIISLLFFSMSFWVPEYLYSYLTKKTKKLTTWYLYFAPISYFCNILIQLFILILYIYNYQIKITIINMFIQFFSNIFITYLLFKIIKLNIEFVLMYTCLIKILELIIIFIIYNNKINKKRNKLWKIK